MQLVEDRGGMNNSGAEKLREKGWWTPPRIAPLRQMRDERAATLQMIDLAVASP